MEIKEILVNFQDTQNKRLDLLSRHLEDVKSQSSSILSQFKK